MIIEIAQERLIKVTLRLVVSMLSYSVYSNNKLNTFTLQNGTN